MRYAGRLAVLILLHMNFAAEGARAQQKSSELVKKQEDDSLVAEFADCVTAQNARRPAVDAFLRKIPDSDGFFDASMKAADLHCLDAAGVRSHSGIQMKLQPDTFRGALYPSLYRRDFGRKGPPAGLSALSPLRLSEEFDGPVESLPPEYAAGRLFGDCVVRQDPQESNVLLLAKPFASQEDAAIEQLKPAFASCIKQDQTLHLTRSNVRASVGEAMYKLSRAAASSTGDSPGRR